MRFLKEWDKIWKRLYSSQNTTADGLVIRSWTKFLICYVKNKLSILMKLKCQEKSHGDNSGLSELFWLKNFVKLRINRL